MYDGIERRQQPCNTECSTVLSIKKTVEGNGKPGLVQDMADVKRAIYGDKPNKIKGMMAIQADIQKLMWTAVGLLAYSQLKGVGADIVAEVVTHLFK